MQPSAFAHAVGRVTVFALLLQLASACGSSDARVGDFVHARILPRPDELTLLRVAERDSGLALTVDGSNWFPLVRTGDDPTRFRFSIALLSAEDSVRATMEFRLSDEGERALDEIWVYWPQEMRMYHRVAGNDSRTEAILAQQARFGFGALVEHIMPTLETGCGMGDLDESVCVGESNEGVNVLGPMLAGRVAIQMKSVPVPSELAEYVPVKQTGPGPQDAQVDTSALVRGAVRISIATSDGGISCEEVGLVVNRLYAIYVGDSSSYTFPLPAPGTFDRFEFGGDDVLTVISNSSGGGTGTIRRGVRRPANNSCRPWVDSLASLSSETVLATREARRAATKRDKPDAKSEDRPSSDSPPSMRASRGPPPEDVKSQCALEADQNALEYKSGDYIDTKAWRASASAGQIQRYIRCLNERWNFAPG